MNDSCVVRRIACAYASSLVLGLLGAALWDGPALAQGAEQPSSIQPPRIFDPGPRPVGAQFIPVKGSLPGTGIPDFEQPLDADGNGAGRQLAKMTPDQTAFWFASLTVFGLTASVDGAKDPSTDNPTIFGLGPSFNAASCFSCHSYPAIGGTSPPVNPQVAGANAKGAVNTLPSFITSGGPVREARFIHSPGDGLPDGAVRPLFSIQGRSDAPAGCTMAQPDFKKQLNRGNVSFRIPTPTFGLGFVEATPDATLEASFAATAAARAGIGIAGHFNTNGNDQTITRFGWKAQNRSLLLFSGEAANVEMGETNELFPTERLTGRNCDIHTSPEDNTNVVQQDTLDNINLSQGEKASLEASDIVNFGIFMRLNAAPSQCAFDSGLDSSANARCVPFTQSPSASSIALGQSLFRSVGCALCHTETLTTGPSPFESLSNASYHPYSDFALHDMGKNLADGVVQGAASGSEFRTAPLWGLGQRLFFLHDGRTNDLVEAVDAHKSAGSEANGVIGTFDSLNDRQKQAILNYLRSL